MVLMLCRFLCSDKQLDLTLKYPGLIVPEFRADILSSLALPMALFRFQLFDTIHKITSLSLYIVYKTIFSDTLFGYLTFARFDVNI